jgi:2-oxo-4-hydroxy-4-carboxy-5-ureidoimidazoline decarboxylase
MTEPHQVLNALSPRAARVVLSRTCGSQRWVDGMMGRLPFASAGAMWHAVDEEWALLEPSDYLEAFAQHPKIGEDVDQLRSKFKTTEAFSREEQSGVIDADEKTLLALRDGNIAYEERFGHIFIVCASGKSAREMLGLLKARLENEPEVELAVAAAEQLQITRLRLQKLSP